MKLDDVIILVVGDRVWGRGATLDEAMANMVKAGGTRRHYIAYVAAPGTYVSDDGCLCFKGGHRPKVIHRVGMFKEKGAKK